MFTIDKYKISFAHYATKKPVKVPFSNTTFTHISYCFIDVLIDDVYDEIVVGETLCSSNDTFEKAIGRKISLTRALHKGGFDREFRTKVWKKYWAITKKPRK